MKTPANCENMIEIREAIDALDYQVVEILGRRFAYVKAAAKFKNTQADVRAPERFAAMLEQRREWAVENGLNADAIEKLFRDLVTHFIEEETRSWRERHAQPQTEPDDAS